MIVPESNIFAGLPNRSAAEQYATLLESPAFKLARIVSTGQATPEGEWYDQDRAEWVVVLKGRAGLRFEDETEDRTLNTGDFLAIAPHRRHRVTWTSKDETTIWLALYFDSEGQD